MNLSASEVIIVLVIALLVFGPKRLPEMARQVGKGIRELKGHMNAVSDHVSDVDVEPATSRGRTGVDRAATDPAVAPTVAMPIDDDELLDGVIVSGGTPPGREPPV